MKLAFVDNFPGVGGLSRFSLLLCRSLVDHYPDLHIDYFIHHNNLAYIPEIKTFGSRVNVILLRSTRPPSFTRRLRYKLFGKAAVAGSKDPVIKEIESVVGSQYDLAYFPTAHMMQRPALPIPVTGTIHDFNWKYFFGQQIFSASFVRMMEPAIADWLSNSYTICSSQDVVDEAKKLYPQFSRYPAVVPIAPVVLNELLPEGQAEEILHNLGIDYPYILFPGNFYPHKNHLNLFTAFSLLIQQPGFGEYKLLLTGLNSDRLPFGIAEYRGVRLNDGKDKKAYDVMGLGYQPNKVIDALISKAKLLVSPSLYEAICTPGMDAWNFGTPTAISDIPPFREHEKTWGIKSAFFDPMDPKNMATVIADYLRPGSSAVEDGRISQQNMRSYTWKDVAAGYMQIFQQAKQQH